MRNITLSDFQAHYFDGLENCEVFFYSTDYILAYDNGRVIKYEENEEKTFFELCNITDLYPTSGEFSIPKALEISYLFEKNSFNLFLCNGDIISIDIKDQSTCSFDIVGAIEDGLKAVKLCPLGEVLALVTGKDIVMVMTNNFDLISAVELHGGGFGEKQFTSVGWGKKETQFRGSEGKFRKESNFLTESKNEFLRHESIKISWRGDAEYFAISCLNPISNQRYLRIFSKKGILQFTSEPIVGLEHTLDWKPSGNLIASTIRLPNKYNICFIEKNGLKHNEFTLPFKQNEIIVTDLMWNEDSRLLALLIERKMGEVDLKDSSTNDIKTETFILIYSVNNYHWYCKYKINFNSENVILIKWDQKNTNLLHVIVKKANGIYHNKYTWIWSICKTKGSSPEDEAFVAVIDGSKVLLTSFQNGIIPPPLCTYSLEMPYQINQVSFASYDGTSSNNLFVLLSNGSVYFYNFERVTDDPIKFMHKLIGELLFKKEKFMYNFLWVSPKRIASCLVDFNKSSKPYLNIIDIHNFNSVIDFKETIYPLQSSIALLKSCNSYLFLYGNDGNIYLFDMHKEKILDSLQKQKQQLIELEIVCQSDGSFIILSLDKSNRFFINDKIIANNVTSFHVHDQFLLLTSLNQRLLCIAIETATEKTQAGNVISDITSRRIERGSRLITSVLKTTKVILQMPRGNLECIQPRALSFSVIGKLLDELQYLKAFDLMRLQRINLNLFYDHNPTLFTENISRFIEEIKDPGWISLFLSDLIDEDVTKIMYAEIYKNKKRENNQVNKSKVQLVCELFVQIIEQMKNSDHYILTILTSYIKRGGIQNLEKALVKVKKLKEAENNGEKLSVLFDEAFRYMLYLIDVEDLYRVALGMYDFDLVLLVATKSQKDPKEYLPFLNDLRKLETNYQKYMIDKYLKRYDKALRHLLNCAGDDFFSECLSFIKTHKMYKAALKLVPRTTDRYKQICANYADDLLKSQMYEEAGIMFSNSGLYSSASEAFRKSGNWQEAISCSNKFQLSDQEREDLYTSIASELIERKKFREAAVIYVEYVKNIEKTLLTLCDGKMFVEAFRIAELHGRDDLIQTHIKPSILEHYKTLKLQMSSFRELFITRKTRLSLVRKKKTLDAKESEDNENVDSEFDSQSESSTVMTHSYAGSHTTNRTFRSAKNKRKQERKLLSLKEGSPFEDLALIASLHNIFKNCLELKPEINELNKCLIKLKEELSAEELQKSLEDLLNVIDGSKAEIWTPELLTGKQCYGPETTSNSIAASFMQSESASSTHLINPLLLIPPQAETNQRWQLEILKN